MAQAPSGFMVASPNAPSMLGNVNSAFYSQFTFHPIQQAHTAPAGPNPDLRAAFYNPYQVKHRHRTTKEQLSLLESTFQTNPKPSSELRRSLAERLGMTPRGVQIWFQNRRAKQKKQQQQKPQPQQQTPRTHAGDNALNIVNNDNDNNDQPATAATTTATAVVTFDEPPSMSPSAMSSSSPASTVPTVPTPACDRSKSSLLARRPPSLVINTSPSHIHNTTSSSLQDNQVPPDTRPTVTSPSPPSKRPRKSKPCDTLGCSSSTCGQIRVFNAAWDGSGVAPLEYEDILNHVWSQTNATTDPASRTSALDPSRIPLLPALGTPFFTPTTASLPSAFSQVQQQQQQQQQRSTTSTFVSPSLHPLGVPNLASAPASTSAGLMHGGDLPLSRPPFSAFLESTHQHSTLASEESGAQYVVPSPFQSAPNPAIGSMFPHNLGRGRSNMESLEVDMPGLEPSNRARHKASGGSSSSMKDSVVQCRGRDQLRINMNEADNEVADDDDDDDDDDDNNNSIIPDPADTIRKSTSNLGSYPGGESISTVATSSGLQQTPQQQQQQLVDFLQGIASQAPHSQSPSSLTAPTQLHQQQVSAVAVAPAITEELVQQQQQQQQQQYFHTPFAEGYSADQLSLYIGSQLHQQQRQELLSQLLGSTPGSSDVRTVSAESLNGASMQAHNGSHSEPAEVKLPHGCGSDVSATIVAVTGNGHVGPTPSVQICQTSASQLGQGGDGSGSRGVVATSPQDPSPAVASLKTHGNCNGGGDSQASMPQQPTADGLQLNQEALFRHLHSHLPLYLEQHYYYYQQQQQLATQNKGDGGLACYSQEDKQQQQQQ